MRSGIGNQGREIPHWLCSRHRIGKHNGGCGLEQSHKLVCGGTVESPLDKTMPLQR